MEYICFISGYDIDDLSCVERVEIEAIDIVEAKQKALDYYLDELWGEDRESYIDYDFEKEELDNNPKFEIFKKVDGEHLQFDLTEWKDEWIKKQKMHKIEQDSKVEYEMYLKLKQKFEK